MYCWHALAAYWAGVHSSMSKYDPRTLYPQPAPGVLEVDPSMAWSCQVPQHPPPCTFEGLRGPVYPGGVSSMLLHLLVCRL